MERWSGKVAVVTGASSGIGWATCNALLDANMVVIGLARRLNVMQELREKLPENQRERFFPRTCDLTSLPSVRCAFHWIEERFAQRMHVLINNAGTIGHSCLLDTGNEESLENVMNVNVLGPVFCTKEAYRLMQKAMSFGEECHIIHVNSLLGHRVPPHIPGCGFNLYPVSKHALTALNEVLRRETQDDKLLRISCISPGRTETEFGASSHRPSHLDDLPELSKCLQPKDVANGILFMLGSPHYVTISELLMVPTEEKF